MGETTAIEFSLQRLDQAALQAQSELANELDVLPKLGSAFVKSIDVANWMSESSTQSPLAQLELDIWRPSVPVILDRVVEGSAAQKAGLQPADQVIAVNNKPMPVFEGFVDFVQQRPDESIVVTVLRNNQQLDLPVDLQSYTDPSGALIGSIGIGVQSISWPTSIVFEQQLGLFDGLVAGFGKSLEMAKLTFGFIVQLVKGLVSIDHLSGPISIVKIASASAESGLITYLAFMAYLSVSLGVLNLLPVPMLDGGHLIYYLIEAATGKKVPDSIQAIGLRIGMVLVFSVMIVAIINDLLRL
jgi:regulator of sigma E protease